MELTLFQETVCKLLIEHWNQVSMDKFAVSERIILTLLTVLIVIMKFIKHIQMHEHESVQGWIVFVQKFHFMRQAIKLAQFCIKRIQVELLPGFSVLKLAFAICFLQDFNDRYFVEESRQTMCMVDVCSCFMRYKLHHWNHFVFVS